MSTQQTENEQTSYFQIAEEASGPVLVLHGTIDIFMADSILSLVQELLKREKNITVQCDKLETIDTSILQILVILNKELMGKGFFATIKNPTEKVSKLLELTGLKGFFKTTYQN